MKIKRGLNSYCYKDADVVENTPNQHFVLLLLRKKYVKKIREKNKGEKSTGKKYVKKKYVKKYWKKSTRKKSTEKNSTRKKSTGKKYEKNGKGKSHVTSCDVTSGQACARYHFRSRHFR